jgi:hypothetical protein
MVNSSDYTPASLLIKAQFWHIAAAAATLTSMRTFCLNEAARYELMVCRSFQTPVLSGGSGAWDGK